MTQNLCNRVQWRAWVMGVLLCGAASLSGAQTSSLPSGVTSNWTPGAAAATLKAAPARVVTLATTAAPATTVYYNTSLTACPAGSTLNYFWYY